MSTPQFTMLDDASEASHPTLFRVIQAMTARGHHHFGISGWLGGEALEITGIHTSDTFVEIELHWSDLVKQAMWPAIMMIDHPSLTKGGITADDVEVVLAVIMRHPDSVQVHVALPWSEIIA